jgi:hypothetical protein
MTTSRSETAFKDKCADWLKRQSHVWFFKVFGNGIQAGGIPDFIICYRGRFVAIELKRPDGQGRLEKRQEAQLRRICEAGGIAVVIDSFDDFKRVFETIDSEEALV